MKLFSRRLPHALPRTDLAQLLTSTYERETGVSEELASERMGQALRSQPLLDRLYEAMSDVLTATQGDKDEDAVIDKMSKAVPKRIRKMDAVPTSPGVAAVIVCFNIEIGEAPMTLRGSLETERGRELLNQGFASIGKHLVQQLLR